MENGYISSTDHFAGAIQDEFYNFSFKVNDGKCLTKRFIRVNMDYLGYAPW